MLPVRPSRPVSYGKTALNSSNTNLRPILPDDVHSRFDARRPPRLSQQRYSPHVRAAQAREPGRSRNLQILQQNEIPHRSLFRRLRRDRRGATAIEYGFLIALIALALTVTLPSISQSLRSTMVTAREGLKGKICESDPTQDGTQCR